MRRTRTHRTARTARTSLAAAAAVTLGLSAALGAAAPAQAASPPWISYQGRSVNMLRLPATTVSLTAYAPTRADAADFVLDGRVVGHDDRVEHVGDRWVSTADVDLSGTYGTTRLSVEYRSGGQTASRFFKYFRAVPAGAGEPGGPKLYSSAPWMAYGGKSLNMQPVPAKVVPVTAYSPDRADEAEFLLGGRVVGRTGRVVDDGSRWVATADVDLTGTSGTTRLDVRYRTGGKVTGGYSKYLDAVGRAAPVTTAPKPTPPAAPTPSRPPVTGSVDTARALPGPGTTGVPAGTALRPSKSLRITADGAVVDGLDVDGCVSVLAKDVTIRNTRIRCDDSPTDLAVKVESGGDRLVLEDVEIDGRGTTEVCVGWSSYTLRRANVHGCADGARFGHRVTIEDSWVHDMARIGTLHPDALQTTSASEVVIRGNVLDPRNTATGDLSNAAIMIGSETGSRTVKRLLIEGNHLDGGNYTVNVRGDITAEAITVRDNVFGTHARYGAFLSPARVPLGTGNSTTGGTAAKHTATR